MATIKWTNKTSVLRAIRRWPDIFEQEFHAALTVIAAILRGVTTELTPTGGGSGPWGHLANSIQEGVPVATPTGHQISYGTPAAYAEVVEQGRRPGGPLPPIEAIGQWVWENRQRFEGVETEEDAFRLAFPIARKIAERGTEGAHMFEKGKEKGEVEIMPVIQRMKANIEARCSLAVGGA